LAHRATLLAVVDRAVQVGLAAIDQIVVAVVETLVTTERAHTFVAGGRAVALGADVAANATVDRVGGSVDFAAVLRLVVAVLEALPTGNDLTSAALALRVRIVQVASVAALAAVLDVGVEGHLAPVGGALIAIRGAAAAQQHAALALLVAAYALAACIGRWQAVAGHQAAAAYFTARTVATAAVDVCLFTVLDAIRA